MILQDIHNEMARHLSNTAGSAAGLARAQAYERGNDFVRAVDTYLSLTPADVESVDVLQQCWEQVRLAGQPVAAAVLTPHASHQAAAAAWHTHVPNSAFDTVKKWRYCALCRPPAGDFHHRAASAASPA